MKAMRKLLTSLWLVFIPLHSVLFAEGKMPGEPERRSYAERAADLTDIKNPLQASYMKDWIEITRGENIALGKTISASVAANYEHAPNNKLENLLDGRLSKSETGKLLFAPEAFGWSCQGHIAKFPRGIWIMVDLQQVYPVKAIAMRVMGGWETISQQAPGRICVLASEDGRDFYEVDSFHKLAAEEADAADGRRLVYLQETGDCFVYPVGFTDLKIRARYLVFQISHARSFFSDEIAVIKGDFDPAEAAFAPDRKRLFLAEGFAFYPNKNVLAVSTNIITPNFFDLIDDRPAEEKQKPAIYCLELPPYLEILKNSPRLEIVSVTDLPSGQKKWSIKGAQYFLGSRIGPLYFKVLGQPARTTSDRAVFHIESESFAAQKIEVPVQLLEIPQAAAFKNFHVSLAWLNDIDRQEWPSFLDAYGHLGFNCVPTHSYYYMGTVRRPRMDKNEVLAFLTEARKRGFKILQNEPTFGMMHGTAKGSDEIYSQLEDQNTPNRTHKSALCPSYRGAFYQQEIQRFAEAVKTIRPDIIFHDTECWGWGCRYAPKCRTCLAYKARLGIADMDEFIFSMGREHMADLKTAISKFYPSKEVIPPCGLYGLCSTRTLAANWNAHSWKWLYPDLVDFSQPSLYTGGNIRKIHETLTAEYQALGKRLTIPWLTTGCPVEFEPRKIEPMLYTAFLEGVAGITYYPFSDFDSPLDFYYHAKALATLAPYEELLASGSIVAVSCDNKSLLTSAWKNPEMGAALVLIYNQVSRQTEKATWFLPDLPAGQSKQLKNLTTGIQLPPADKNLLSLEPGECALFLLENK